MNEKYFGTFFSDTHEIPHIRQAEEKDYEAVSEIILEVDVHRFLALDKVDENQLSQTFKDFLKGGYVLELDGKVIGIYRIHALNSHIISLETFAIHPNFQKKGYGTLCAKDSQEKIKELYPNAKLVVFRQQRGNIRVSKMAEPKGFIPMVHFPDWHHLTEEQIPDNTQWPYIGGVFYEHLLDDSISIIDNTPFKPTLPQLNLLEECYQVVFDQDDIFCIKNNEKLATFKKMNFDGKVSHTQYGWITFSENYLPEEDSVHLEKFFRQIFINEMMDKSRKKNVSLFTHDPRILNLMQKLGLHCRGKRTAGLFKDGQYHNYIFMDLSFFDVNDALQLLQKTSSELDKNEAEAIKENLIQWEENIKDAFNEGYIDRYMSVYLKNFAYQIVRESYEPYYSKETAPWQSLSEEIFSMNLPIPMKKSLQELLKIFSIPVNLNLSELDYGNY